MGNAVIKMVAGCLGDLITTQLDYVWNYESNFEDLDTQLQQLRDTYAEVKHRVDEANRNGDGIEQIVMNWLDRVEKIDAEAIKVIEDNNQANMRCLQGLCPDLKKRYQHSKEAARKADDISELLQEGTFDRVSYHTLPAETWHHDNYENIKSRRSTLERILNALRDHDVDMVGVYGIGGSGKTRLVREVARIAERDRLFDRVVFVEVSDSKDERIRQVIEEKLGSEFKEKTECVRADRLRKRLEGGTITEETECVRADRLPKHLEGSKIKEETGCVRADGQRKYLEGSKIKEETERVRADGQRKHLEGSKIKEETERVSADGQRKHLEGSKIKQETERVRADGQRKHLEGSKIKEETECVRADRQQKHLEGSKILIILDDIWKDLDLAAVGIPGGINRKGCRLLLTSRNIRLLNEMGSKTNFPVDILEEEEARKLFMKMAGVGEEQSHLRSLAIEVAKECGGLLVAIVTIAKALQEKQECEWRVALQELRNPLSLEDVEEAVVKKAYASIRLSYTNLRGEELKSTFLLCSIMGCPKDASIEELLRYVVGLSLFNAENTVEDTRNRVKTVVQKLKDASLLLGTPNGETFSIHDVIHDVGRWIASSQENKLVVINNRIPRSWAAKNKLEKCTSITFHDIDELPKSLECPQLKFFYMKTKVQFTKVPDEFFKGMLNLEVLHFVEMDLSILPKSLCLLRHLRTLNLDMCRVGDIAEIKDMENLEILVISSVDKIKQLSEEIGRLISLRLLDLRKSSFIIPPKTISRLTQLEELYMDDWYDQQQVEELGIETSVASLEELKDLPFLTALNISVKDAAILPKGLDFFQKLKRYKIVIGEYPRDMNKTSRVLQVTSDTNLCTEDGVIKQLKGIEDLLLDGEQRITNVLCELNGEGFPKLKHFRIKNNPFIFCIVDSMLSTTCVAFPLLETLLLSNLVSLEKICHDQFKTKCFCQLRTIKVKSCHELKNIFSFSVVKYLSMLQKIEVVNCWNIEEIFIDDRADNGVIDPPFFEQLHSLTLKDLPRLLRICSETEVASTSQERRMPLTTNASSSKIILEDQLDDLPLLGKKVVFSNLKLLRLHGINLKCVFSSYIHGSFNHLQHLEIEDCKDLEELIRIDDKCSNYVEFPSLERLQINNCSKLREFIFSEKVLYPSLQEINISDMANLGRIWQSQVNQSIQYCPKLCTVTLRDCQKLENIFPFSIARTLWHLEVLNVDSCGIKEIVAEDGRVEEVAARFFFPQLTYLSLDSLEELNCFYPGKHTTEWPKLKELVVRCCEKIDLFSFQKHDMEGQLNEDHTVPHPLFLVDQVVFSNLNLLRLHGINLKCVFSSYTLGSFNHLQRLEIEDCKDLEELIRIDDKCRNYVEFPSLERLQINNCSELREFLFSEKVSYPSLQEINISDMANLGRIWQSQVNQSIQYCPKLCTVTLRDCQNLENIFPVSIARTLWHLEVLNVDSCGIKEIVAEDGRVEEVAARFFFPQLTYLSLDSLEELNCFYPGKHTTEWPKLKQLVVRCCEKIDLFSFQKHDMEGQLNEDHTVPHPLFLVDQVVFSNLNLLRLHGINLKCVFSSYTLGSFNHLQRLEIEDCKDLEELIRIDDKCRNYVEFPSLERLQINNCSELREFLFSEKVSYPSLQEINISDMANLGRIWQSQVNQSIQYCPKLCTVTLRDCQNLENIFPVSIARTLWHLEVLNVDSCGIKEIVAEDGRVEEVAARFFFPQLTYLSLDSLEELNCFYPGKHTTEWPKLKELVVRCCEKIDLFSFQKHDMEGQLNEDHTVPHSLFLVDQAFLQLEKVTTNKNHLRMICQSSIPKYLFPKLKSLKGEDDGSTILPHGILEKFHNLEMLQLESSSYKEIFSCEEVEKHVGICAQLKKLHLSQLYNLKQIWKQESKMDLIIQKLEFLEVSRCFNLINLMPPSALFKNLKILKVNECHRLISLVSASAANSLMVLEEMSIQFCKEMTEIIENQGDAMEGEITLSRLKSLKLYELTNLTSFYSGNYTIIFPLLDQLEVYNCPELKFFSLRALSAPKLQEVWQEWAHYKCEHPDLNTTFKQIRDKKVFSILEQSILSSKDLRFVWNSFPEYTKVFSSAKQLELSGKDIGIMWQSQFPKHIFPKLKCLDISNDTSTVFPFGSIFQRFHNLEKLKLTDCSYEEIFSYEEIEKYAWSPPQIKCLHLASLCDVKQMWKKDSKLNLLENLESLEVEVCESLNNVLLPLSSFENLKIMKVNNCEKLRSLMAASTAKSLVQLEEMQISWCEMMTQVVANGGDIVKDKILFYKLKKLELNDLSCLTSFSFENYIFEIPNLEKLTMKECPKMEIFTLGNLSTPMLHEVWQDQIEYICKDDLNEIVRQHHEKMIFSRRIIGFKNIKMMLQKNPEHQENFSNLVALDFTRDEIGMFWQSQFPHQLFPNLELLGVFEDESTVFPLAILQRFRSVEQLELFWGSYEEIFSCEDFEKYAGASAQIKFLSLYGLDNLKQMWKQDSSLDLILPNIEVLQVEWCGSLVTLVPPSSSFQNLTKLIVVGCDGLMNLLAPATAKSLVQLKGMGIRKCKTMTEVISSDEEAVTNEEISFIKLQELELDSLSSLTSFCPGNYTFTFPYLSSISLKNCPKMNFFSSGVLNTPRLEKVEHDSTMYYCGDDLEATIQGILEKLNTKTSPEDCAGPSTLSSSAS